MTARMIHNIGSIRVDELTGDEIFTCRSGSQRDKEITAQKLRHYFGGDIASPNFKLERGANSARFSDLPNAEFDMREGDLLTGLQNGLNVNFSRMQILRSLLVALEVDRDLIGCTVETLPNPAEAGMQAFVMDGAGGLGWGDEIRGGGSMFYKCWYNGCRWTVTGK